jgi:hypothetical protein
MRLAYFLMLHNNPAQVRWLTRAISNPHDLFCVHIDRRTPASVRQEFLGMMEGCGNLIVLPSRFMAWGGWNLAAIEAAAIRALVAHSSDWSYFINLSGTDYPLMHREDMVSELRDQADANYVTLLDFDKTPPHVRSRLGRVHVTLWKKRVRTPLPYPLPRDFQIAWKGSNWHILTRDFCEWIANSPLTPKVENYLKWVGVPDEFLIQTLIMNSPFRDTAMDNRRLIFWPGPQTVTMAQKDALLSSNAFFSRKFNQAVDVDVLHLLANRIGAATP